MAADQQQQQLVLLHGASHVELDAALATRRGGLRALEREAERAFGLAPQSFGLFARSGRVESPEALQRALEASAGGPCRLELREHAEWRALNRAAEALEGRLMAKVEAALAGVREDLARTEARLDRGLAPMVQSLALEQIDLRTSVEALRGLAPMVQSVAMEQLDVREKLAAQEAAAPAPAAAAPQLVMLCAPAGGKACAEEEEPASAAAALKDLEALEQQLRQELGGRLGAVEQADEYLFSELQAVRDCTKGVERDVEELQAGLQGLERQQRERAEEAKDSARPQASPKHAAGSPDAWLSWSEGLPAGIPYSGKAVVVDFPKGAAHGRRGGAASKWAGTDLAPAEGLTPFARVSALRPLERTPGCQSLPLLPPLR